MKKRQQQLTSRVGDAITVVSGVVLVTWWLLLVLTSSQVQVRGPRVRQEAVSLSFLSPTDNCLSRLFGFCVL
jgi:hypothetical protein